MASLPHDIKTGLFLPHGGNALATSNSVAQYVNLCSFSDNMDDLHFVAGISNLLEDLQQLPRISAQPDIEAAMAWLRQLEDIRDCYATELEALGFSDTDLLKTLLVGSPLQWFYHNRPRWTCWADFKVDFVQDWVGPTDQLWAGLNDLHYELGQDATRHLERLYALWEALSHAQQPAVDARAYLLHSIEDDHLRHSVAMNSWPADSFEHLATTFIRAAHARWSACSSYSEQPSPDYPNHYYDGGVHPVAGAPLDADVLARGLEEFDYPLTALNGSTPPVNGQRCPWPAGDWDYGSAGSQQPPPQTDADYQIHLLSQSVNEAHASLIHLSQALTAAFGGGDSDSSHSGEQTTPVPFSADHHQCDDWLMGEPQHADVFGGGPNAASPALTPPHVSHEASDSEHPFAPAPTTATDQHHAAGSGNGGAVILAITSVAWASDASAAPAADSGIPPTAPTPVVALVATNGSAPQQPQLDPLHAPWALTSTGVPPWPLSTSTGAWVLVLALTKTAPTLAPAALPAVGQWQRLVWDPGIQC